MSTVVYNNVGLLRCQELEFSRTPIWQGPDYLWTRYVLRVRGVFNPEINAYSFSNGPAAYQVPAENLSNPANAVFVMRSVPGARRLANIAANGIMANSISPVGSPLMAEGTGAPVTDQAIRHTLLQARGQLFYAVGNVPLLVSPSVNQDGTIADTDASNGPFPLACDVVQISGTKTFLVDFAIEAYVNEAFLFADTASVLLSHRWDAEEMIDQDYYSARQINGRAVFRSDRLLFLDALPDDFRIALFHPLPGPGWKRTAVNVHVDESGTSLDYTIVDKQLALSIIPVGVTRIEAWQEVDTESLSLEKAFLSAVGGFGGLPGAVGSALGNFQSGGGLRSLFFGNVGIPNPAGFASAASGLLSSFSNLSSGLLRTAAEAIPRVKIAVVVRVWGRSDIGRKTLEATAAGVLFARFSTLNGLGNFLGETKITLGHDLAGTFVEARATKTTALGNQVVTAATNPLSGAGLVALNFPDPGLYFPDSDDTLPYLTDMHGNVTPLGLPNRPTSAGIGTRGTFVSRLVTAALLDADDIPVNPPAAMPFGGAVMGLTPP